MHGVDVVVLLQDMNSILELDVENLTATVEAGLCWSTLQETLAGCERGYEVPLDPALPDRATVGGVLATASSGPRRNLCGSVRNLVLGAVVITANGDRVRFGGKTVKNVSGLDMTKAFLGSLGTLGILVEATLRFLPLPPAQTTTLVSGEHQALWDLAEDILSSSLYPASLTWFCCRSLADLGVNQTVEGEEVMAVALEGSQEGVSERWDRLISLARGLSIDRMEGNEGRRLWARVRDVACPPSGLRKPLTLKITIPPARSPDLAKRLEESAPAICLIHTGTGEAWAHWELAESDIDLLGLVQGLRSTVRSWEGHLVVAHAPFDWKNKLDIWGLDPIQRSLVWELKKKLDPHKTLAPGRWGEPA
jgi:glycolate oxidase FAD binding subunit